VSRPFLKLTVRLFNTTDAFWVDGIPNDLSGDNIPIGRKQQQTHHCISCIIGGIVPISDRIRRSVDRINADRVGHGSKREPRQVCSILFRIQT
jgi:hypothetical protein